MSQAAAAQQQQTLQLGPIRIVIFMGDLEFDMGDTPYICGGVSAAQPQLQRTGYPTRRHAALAALSSIVGTSTEQGYEYGGLVFGEEGGTFGLTGPYTIYDQHAMDPAFAAAELLDLTGCGMPGEAVAAYHTHGADTRRGSEMFSCFDIDYSNHYRIDGFLLNRENGFWHYDRASSIVFKYELPNTQTPAQTILVTNPCLQFPCPKSPPPDFCPVADAGGSGGAP